MRNFSLTMKSLVLGGLFLATLAVVTIPSTSHAAGQIGPKAIAQAAKTGKTIKSEECSVTPAAAAVGAPSVIDATEDFAEKNGGSCTITYVGGGQENLNFSDGAVETTSKDPKTGEVARTSEADSAAGGGAFSGTEDGGGTGGCGIKSFGSLGNCLIDAIATFVLGFANFMLGIAGVLLNWVVVKTVFQFSQLIGNSDGLLKSWSILRDVGNLLLLFGFVMMGIGTILDTNKLPDKKAIPMLIIFAVLLNFSIFAAEAVIDTSNVLTSVMYTQANSDQCDTEACGINYGIAGHIMQSTGLSGIYGMDVTKIGGSNKTLVLFGLTIFSLVGTIVLLAAALMLAFRAVILTGLIIVSPIGFAGMAVPQLNKMAKQWWSMLIHQAFFAPILFLLIFISLKVTEGFSGTAANNHNLAQALTAGAGTSNMGIIMVFILIIGALVASLMAAKSFGAMGADFAVRTASNVAIGSGAFIGRRTFGAGSAWAGRSIRSSSIGETRVGRALAGVTDVGAKSSFDVRATKTFATVTKPTKLDFGKPNKTAAKGYDAIMKKDIDAKASYANSFKMSTKQEEAKKELDATKAATEKEQKSRAATLDTRSTQLKQVDTKAKSDWQTREAVLDSEILGLEAKVAGNEGGKETSRLEQEIAAEKLKAQRFQSTGETKEWFDAEARVKALQKERDEYVSAAEKLAAARKTKEAELDTHSKTIARISDDLNKVDAEKQESEQKYSAEVAQITAQLNAIDPKKRKERYAENLRKNKLGGRSNREAANKIIGDMKKTRLEKAFDGLGKQMKDNNAGSDAEVAALLNDIKDSVSEDNKTEG